MLNTTMSVFLESEQSYPEAEGAVPKRIRKRARKRSLDILLVEDVFSDAALTRIALEATGISHTLSRIKSGDEVLAHLGVRRRLPHQPLPDVILLDLGLPMMDGFEVLAEMMQASPEIRSVPIVILTAHQHFEYLRSVYPFLCIMDYINKPCSPPDMRRILSHVQTREEPTHTWH